MRTAVRVIVLMIAGVVPVCAVGCIVHAAMP
jgi:hypothetical protein